MFGQIGWQLPKKSMQPESYIRIIRLRDSKIFENAKERKSSDERWAARSVGQIGDVCVIKCSPTHHTKVNQSTRLMIVRWQCIAHAHAVHHVLHQDSCQSS